MDKLHFIPLAEVIHIKINIIKSVFPSIEIGFINTRQIKIDSYTESDFRGKF